MKLPRRAMAEDDFWQLIELLGGSVDDDAVARLTDELRARGRKASVGFAERLAATLYELDREVLARRLVRWADAPDEPPIPLSDDSFLYLRAGIVARGRAVVEAVLNDPSVVEDGVWEDGEALLYAAEDAADDEIETAYSYESASNREHWTPVSREAVAYERPPVALLTEDRFDSIQGFLDAAMTVPSPVMYLHPRWLPDAVQWSVADRLTDVVRANGGVPPQLDVVQLQVYVAFGDDWQLDPAIEWRVQDETALSETVLKAHVEMVQSVVRSWSVEQQRAGLLAVSARCLLAVLPPDHGARPGLEAAAAAGAELLPA